MSLSFALLLVPVAAGASGFLEFPASLAGVPPGAQFFTQCVWLNTATCGGAGTLSASNALDVRT